MAGFESASVRQRYGNFVEAIRVADDVAVGEDVAVGADHQARAGGGAISLLGDHVVERRKEVPERIAQAIALQHSLAVGDVNADHRRLRPFDRLHHSGAPRGSDFVGGHTGRNKQAQKDTIK